MCRYPFFNIIRLYFFILRVLFFLFYVSLFFPRTSDHIKQIIEIGLRAKDDTMNKQKLIQTAVNVKFMQ